MAEPSAAHRGGYRGSSPRELTAASGGEPGEAGIPVAVGALGEVEEGLNVLDGRDDAEGDPDRAAGRHAREDEVVIDRRVFRPGPQEEPPRPGEVAAAQPERGLASSRVAE